MRIGRQHEALHYPQLGYHGKEWIRRLNAANSGSVTEPPRRIRGKRPHGASTDELLVDVDYHMFSIDVRENLSGALALLL